MPRPSGHVAPNILGFNSMHQQETESVGLFFKSQPPLSRCTFHLSHQAVHSFPELFRTACLPSYPPAFLIFEQSQTERRLQGASPPTVQLSGVKMFCRPLPCPAGWGCPVWRRRGTWISPQWLQVCKRCGRSCQPHRAERRNRDPDGIWHRICSVKKKKKKKT